MPAQPKIVATTEFKIEKGIPLPVGHGNSKYPYAALEVGDSVELPAKASASAYAWAKTHQRKFVIRPVSANAIRVWRTA